MTDGWFLAHSINDSASDKSVNGLPPIPLWEGKVQCTLMKPDVPGWDQGTARLRKSATSLSALSLNPNLRHHGTPLIPPQPNGCANYTGILARAAGAGFHFELEYAV